jgi:hypothetical protein
LKHDESDDVVTRAETLVPPEPNPVLSLTYQKKWRYDVNMPSPHENFMKIRKTRMEKNRGSLAKVGNDKNAGAAVK